MMIRICFKIIQWHGVSRSIDDIEHALTVVETGFWEHELHYITLPAFCYV